MIVRDKDSSDGAVISSGKLISRLSSKVERIIVALSRRSRGGEIFSPAVAPINLLRFTQEYRPDVVHLHWIADGFIGIESLSALTTPIVWTNHDMWPFTGGCHYSGSCKRYEVACGNCPSLASTHEGDLSHWTHQRKMRNWSNLSLTVVSPSKWLAACAASSSLFSRVPIHVIPNCLDTKVFYPRDKDLARKALGLCPTGKIILFGAGRSTEDPRKGFPQLLGALRIFIESKGVGAQEIALVIYGADHVATGSDAIIPCRHHFLGSIANDQVMAQLYASADVFVAPSLQDNLPNTVMEALSCGTPVVAFRVGGIIDMVDHLQNGYLADVGDVTDLATGISYVLDDEERHARMQATARRKVINTFSEAIVAEAHYRLYSALVAKRQPSTP
jgi:glycosyltransferase involved in cell wall biosynthesis